VAQGGGLPQSTAWLHLHVFCLLQYPTVTLQSHLILLSDNLDLKSGGHDVHPDTVHSMSSAAEH
jgi:hypothetical protein